MNSGLDAVTVEDGARRYGVDIVLLEVLIDLGENLLLTHVQALPQFFLFQLDNFMNVAEVLKPSVSVMLILLLNAINASLVEIPNPNDILVTMLPSPHINRHTTRQKDFSRPTELVIFQNTLVHQVRDVFLRQHLTLNQTRVQLLQNLFAGYAFWQVDWLLVFWGA